LLLIFNACTLSGNLLIAGAIAPSLPCNHLARHICGKKLILEGILYKAPQDFPAKTKYYVLVHKMIEKDRERPVTGKLLLTVRQPQPRLGYGDVVRFCCRMRHPRNFNNPGSFNYQRYLAFQDIYVIASLDAKHPMVKVGERPNSRFMYRMERIRQRIKDFFAARLASPAAEIATALITGEQSGIPQDMRDQFSVAGVSHVLAISGLNIGIIALITLAVSQALCRCSTRLMLMINTAKLSAVLTLFPVAVYCLIAGAGIAVLRATVMVIAYLFSIIIDRQDDLWNTLGLAAFLICLVSPPSLFDCSFQLSFVSVAAILYLNPRLSFRPFNTSAAFPGTRKRWYHSLLNQSMTVLTVTLAATIGTAPLVALYFNRCSPWGIPANLILVPLTGFLVVPLGLITAALCFISYPLAVITAEITEVLIVISNAAVGFFSALPYANYRIATPTLPEMSIYYAGVVLLVHCRRSAWARYGMVVVILTFIGDAGYWYYQNKLNPRLRITAIDVGQGESTLLQLPGGKTMLIDGGGFYDSGFDTGGMVVSPLLWHKKISQIDVVVLSHPHPDHLNGLISVMKNFEIGEVWSNGEAIDTEAYAVFDALIAERKIKKTVISRGHPHTAVNGVMIEFLHPGPFIPDEPMRSSHQRMNNNSLVMRISYREVSILFTGDIGWADERDIMALYPGLTCTILKIPHHGSATSSSQAFLQMLRPRMALLSVGSDNSFNLPHPDVISRYADAGCRIFRTDSDGAVSLETDGRGILIRFFKEEEQPIASAQQGALIESYNNRWTIRR
jgi:competence protein ComEC